MMLPQRDSVLIKTERAGPTIAWTQVLYTAVTSAVNEKVINKIKIYYKITHVWVNEG